MTRKRLDDRCCLCDGIKLHHNHRQKHHKTCTTEDYRQNVQALVTLPTFPLQRGMQCRDFLSSSKAHLYIKVYSMEPTQLNDFPGTWSRT